ncbi:MAG: hypothetical protein R6V62_02255 [Candidatus Fermentibacteraceae bacterium]
MKSLFAALLLISLPLFPGNIVVDLPGGAGEPWFSLTYFNGTPQWFTWSGTYRGTWFNTQDFMPGGGGIPLGQVEYWFYESANTHPWDTDDFYSEIWDGNSQGPTVLRTQGPVTALHYAPCYHVIEPDLDTEVNFWCIINTEMSAGGWPSILADYSMPGDAGHSFFSDDFSIWESLGDMGEFYIEAQYWYSLEATTWGSLKALF